MEINVAGLHGDVKVIQNEDAFYCNAAIAVPPVAKKENGSNFLHIRFLSCTCTEVSGVENIGQCGRLSQLRWLLGTL